MRYLVVSLVLMLLCGLIGCSGGGISQPFDVILNLLPKSGEAPLSVYGTVQIEGGASADLSDYNFRWTISSVPQYQSFGSTFNYVFPDVSTNRIDVWVTDKATGQTVHAFGVVTVQPDTDELQVLLDFLDPDEDADGKAPIGKVPFTVELTAHAMGGVEPYWYEWDMNSDGIFEAFGFNVDTYTGTYVSPGTFQITVRVSDMRMTTAIDSRFINVLPSNPIARANALPPEGKAPLFVIFSASGSYDPDGKIELYEWDFDGDGTYDWESMVTGSTSSGYPDPGNYYPTLRVTDNDGLTGLSTTQVVVTF
jgi:hypothetical protein